MFCEWCLGVFQKLLLVAERLTQDQAFSQRLDQRTEHVLPASSPTGCHAAAVFAVHCLNHAYLTRWQLQR
jgi:hypothetical protein